MRGVCRYFSKALGASISLSLISGSCEDKGIFSGMPSTGPLFGKWQLEKIVTPAQTSVGSQIGYSEVLEITSEDGYQVDKTFRNDSLVSKHYWGPRDGHSVNTKKITYLMKYRFNEIRFFKIYPVTGAGDKMEASGYLSQIGAPEDTITYYYNQVWPQ